MNGQGLVDCVAFCATVVVRAVFVTEVDGQVGAAVSCDKHTKEFAVPARRG